MSNSILRFIIVFLCSTSVLSLHWRVRRQACSGKKFQCNNGQCISKFSVCDGAKDCKDGSDETLVLCRKPTFVCPYFAFRCAYGACVNNNTKCDGKQDCADNSDELLPECKPNKQIRENNCRKDQFACDSGQCIGGFLPCDGRKDCADGSDETISQCISFSCPKFSFKCGYGACIDNRKKCDGKDDCADGSDELQNLCDNYIPLSTQTSVALESPNKQVCYLPEKPRNGDYSIVIGCGPSDMSAKCRKIPGTPVTEIVLSFSCKEGYSLSEAFIDSPEATCYYNGTWSRPPPKCFKMCKGLQDDTLSLLCTFRGTKVDCKRPVRPDTSAKVQCKTGYHPADPTSAFITTVCQSNGDWSRQLYTCSPECGIRNRKVTSLISYGTPTEISEFPWHVALFGRNDTYSKFEQICGGSIVTKRLVITAAHCIYRGNSTVNPNLLMVATGKFTRSLDRLDPYEQRIEVAKVFKRRSFRGQLNRYEQDVAILYLKKDIKFGLQVMPVCIAWFNGSYIPFKTGAPVTVIGWGLTEKKVPSPVLRTATLEFYDYDTCVQLALEHSFEMYITYDKICAGLKNGTSVHEGDSGGSLTYEDPKSSSYFLYGIISNKPTDSLRFAAFTNIMMHVSWIDGIRNCVALEEAHRRNLDECVRSIEY